MKKRKSFGQHFLIRDDIAEDIVNSLIFKQQEANVVVEVGPGEGVLTKFLVTKKPLIDLYLIELDRRLPKYLVRKFPDLEGRITNADVLKVDLADILPALDDVYMIGNFPYNISTQILFRVLEYKNNISQVVGMFQKEVAKRVAATSGSKTYGVITVLIQFYYKVTYLFEVGADCFDPPPKVQSAVIRLERHHKYEGSVDYADFRRVVKQAFSQRRKKLSNALKNVELDKTKFDTAWLDKRAEQLSLEDFICLAKALVKE
ncbi:MAG: 16S rRNA (adenine(1518)-N(6)/adenine(1519)-N(6))-dimethyltransferase RsmA [Chitinophagales bacterium]